MKETEEVMADENKQLLHIVIGGELKSVDTVEFRDLTKVDLVGAYPNYAQAHAAWRAKALGSVVIALMCFFIFLALRLVVPS